MSFLFGSGKNNVDMPAIAIINLSGEITDDQMFNSRTRCSITYSSTRLLVEKALAIPNIWAIILNINSNGGSPTQTNKISTFIRRKVDEAGVKLFALIEDMAASGGYWIACAADEIYANPCSMVGSIGVIKHNIGVHDLLEKIGVKVKVITTGKNKADGNPFVGSNEDEEEIIQENMSVIQEAFQDWVRARRGNKITDETKVMSGRLFGGRLAVEAGLVDGLVCDAQELLDEKIGEIGRDVKMVEIQEEKNSGLVGFIMRLLNFPSVGN